MDLFKSSGRPRGRSVALLVAGLLAGTVLIQPAVAHVTRRLGHLQKHLDKRYYNVGEKVGDANTLDGQNSTAFLGAGAKAADADELDGIDSSAYRQIQLPAQAAFFANGASYNDGNGINAGIVFPDASVPTATWQFMLPPDFASGTSPRVRLTWHTPATSCGINLERNLLSVSRSGLAPFGNQGSISPGQVNVINAPGTANQAGVMEFTISGTVAGNTLQAGDSVTFGVFRSSGSGTDNCAADLRIHGAEALY